ncbi:MAG TPA: hypothetical protein VFX48_02280, partial [Saprospiraceae bacterium]|nr:hypothetical protein [Saprospiraceae bacterium]
MFLNRGPWCILILIFILTAHTQAQFLKGRILDNISQKPVPGAVIYEWGTGHSGITDDAGFFELHFPSDMEAVELQITAEAYETFSIHLRAQDWNPDTQEFFLFPANSILELALETNQAVSDDEAGEDEVFSLLHSARDPVKDAASFQFGSFRYRLRGVSGIYDQLGFNGFLLNDPVTGYLPFYLFSGQSLLTKYGDDYLGYKDNPSDFGSSGLAQWITSKPSSYRKEFSIRYAHANRSYDNRLDLFYSSGPLRRGWGVIAGVNRRCAQEAFSPGSYYDA